MVKSTKIRLSKSDRFFYAICYALLTILFISVLYPIIFVLSASFSSGSAVAGGRVTLFPVELSIEGYKAVFRYKRVLSGYWNTFQYTVIGTAINVAICMICAYPMSRKDLPGRGLFMVIFTFTMYFGGGMIPNYILMRNLGILDSILVMILPGALSVYNMILARTFIQSNIPNELFEAAELDGCSDLKYFTTIVLPLSKAIIAVIAMYSAVGHWNAYFNAMLYLDTPSKMPLQIILREILIANQFDSSMTMDPELMEARANLADVLKYSLIVISTVPILCVYPFIQKYFVQGVMIGSLKG